MLLTVGLEVYRADMSERGLHMPNHRQARRKLQLHLQPLLRRHDSRPTRWYRRLRGALG